MEGYPLCVIVWKTQCWKMSVLPKLIYRINSFSIKISHAVFMLNYFVGFACVCVCVHVMGHSDSKIYIKVEIFLAVQWLRL